MRATRRSVLKAGALATGGLWIGFSLRTPAFAAASFQPNAFIRIERSGVVTLVVSKAEMGQGVFTALPQLLAEELEVSLDRVRLEQSAPDDARYGEPLFGGLQMTGGSTSIRGAWVPMRQAGAAARTMLIEAAARQWKVDVATLRAQYGRVIGERGRSLGYGDLADAASRLPVPQQVVLKDMAAFRLIGKPLHRLDAKGKVDGSAVFGIDVKRPGLKIAAVAASPVFER